MPKKAAPPPPKRPKKAAAPASVLDVVARMRAPSGEHYEPPRHLAPYVALLDRAVLDGSIRAVIAAPPQVGKSTCGIAALVFIAMRRPGTRNVFVSFGQARSEQARRDLLAAAADLGIPVDASGELVTLGGKTTVRFTSTDGALTGFACDGLLIVDDAVKDDSKAHSRNERDRLFRWFMRTAMSRAVGASEDGTRPGTSVIVVATRQHADDLSGRLIKTGEWTNLRIPAICDSEDDPLDRKIGEALWPAQRSLRSLAQLRATDPGTFLTLYQGLPPTGDGLCLFPDAQRCALGAVPRDGRVIHAVDMAYSARGDYCVFASAVAVSGKLYVFQVVRRRELPELFVQRVADAVRARPGVCGFRHAETELAAVEDLRRAGVRSLRTIPAKESKSEFAHASGTVRAWLERRIFIARGSPDLDTFAAEVESFVGDDRIDGTNDCVDVLTTLCAVAGVKFAGAYAPANFRIGRFGQLGVREPGTFRERERDDRARSDGWTVHWSAKDSD